MCQCVLTQKIAGIPTLMPQPLVYVVILNWNLKDDTAECVASVLRSDYSNYRVLVVDNGSSDGSEEYLRRAFPSSEFIANAVNLGFAAGNNIGIRYAVANGTDYVFLLNNDTAVDAAMLGQLVSYAESDPDAGMVAPKVLYYTERNRIWRLGERVQRWLPVPLSVGRDQLDIGQFPKPLELDYVAFCGVLIRRSVLDKVGLLDERFFFGYEDADLCHRTRDAGYRIVCQPAARMWHKVSRSAQKDAQNIGYQRSKGRAIFYRRYAHGPHPLLTAAYLWGSTLLMAATSALRGDPGLARLMVRGLYDGYRERVPVS